MDKKIENEVETGLIMVYRVDTMHHRGHCMLLHGDPLQCPYRSHTRGGFLEDSPP